MTPRSNFKREWGAFVALSIFVVLANVVIWGFLAWAIIGILNYFGITDVNLPGLP